MNNTCTNLSSTLDLSNGVKIPCIGFGTWKMPDEVVEDAVSNAITCGYRHIDTAAAYFNEAGVGKGIKKSGIRREELFVTSKLPNAHHGYENTLASFHESLKRLDLDYLDLYLIHWPVVEEHKDCYEEDIIETWQAFEKLYEEGKIRAIGVSNFMIEHLEILIKNSKIKPMVNQIQLNPQCTEDKLLAYCRENNICVEGWSPLIQGKAFEREILQDMARKYNKTIAQICVRFVFQLGAIPIPKSANPDRIINNGDVFDFEISEEDMKAIASLNVYGRIGDQPNVPRKFQNAGFKIS
ncbi:glyoxal/methylglyoxal reductase [Anaerocolumna aminovalerica]|uniref:Aldo/keto reductase n=1 Tax=Anaerocolumna aminovalerica TaxID=1527 RepID=A0A1I5BLN3_9FIRM|nr:aldo/keto reductase [Anaerocolumna aminovalerica]SFN75577.1 Aldo/keto reductase [Anaerocolumna aminovalerica]